MRRASVLSLVLLVLCASASLAAAPPRGASLEIPLAGGLLPETFPSLERSSPQIAAIEARYGGQWYGSLNPRTGTAHLIYGSSVNLGAGYLADAAAAEAAARNFIGSNTDLFAVELAELVVQSLENGLGQWGALFTQTVDGLEIYGSRVTVAMTESGRAFAFGADVYPGAKLSGPVLLGAAEAAAAAQRSLGSDAARDDVREAVLLVLPVEVESELPIELRPAYRVHIRSEEPYGDWMSFVDAADGAVLWRYNRVRMTNVTGTVDADAEDIGYCQGLSLRAMANMTVSVTGGNSAVTNAQGQYDITHGGTSSVTVTARFRGSWFDIDRYTGTNPTFSGTATPGTPFTIHWGASNSRADERDCWLHANRAHDWIKRVDPLFTSLDYMMPISVGRTDFYCPGNAWWDGTGMNFCEAGSGYGNTGQMGDVVYHEYGHGITQEVYGFPEPPGDMHEGNSDVAGNFNSRFSLIGQGFYLNNCTSGIRNSNNSLQYPDDWTGENHFSGQIIAGVHWDLWQDLLASMPQAEADSIAFRIWHYARKLYQPMNQPDQVAYLFVTDDDDGELGNGTPHYDAICLGATNHGFACPPITVGVFITHTPLGTTTDTVGPYPVTATIYSTAAALEPDSLRVRYRVDGGPWSFVTMAPTGSPDQFRGLIPGQLCGSVVDYYISAADVAGNRKVHPAGAPASFHSFHVLGAEIARHDFEAATGWTVGDAGDNATSGVWERGNPSGTVYNGEQIQPEDDVTPPPGVNCYATQLAAGANAGAYDVDGGKTTLKSPLFDLSAYSSAIAEFSVWVYSGTLQQQQVEPEALRLYASPNGGSTWTLIYQLIDSGGWNLVSVDIGSFIALTDQVRFRFVIQDLPTSNALVEAAVDEFRVLGCPAVDTQAPTVAVSSPNGSEEWVQGEHQDITWSATDNVGVTGVTLVLSQDDGASYPDTVAVGEANDGVFDWVVTGGPSDSCRVKVIARDAAGNVNGDESDGVFRIVSPSTGVTGEAAPSRFELWGVAPNPASGWLTVRYEIPVSSRVEVVVYDVSGRPVRTLVSREQGPGRYAVRWDGRREDGTEAASGVYFTKLRAGAYQATSRAIVLR